MARAGPRNSDGSCGARPRPDFSRIASSRARSLAQTPIVVDHVLDHEGPAAVLINLYALPPPFFSRFERLAEIVSRDEAELAAGRERWKFYKARGYEIRSYDLSARA